MEDILHESVSMKNRIVVFQNHTVFTIYIYTHTRTQRGLSLSLSSRSKRRGAEEERAVVLALLEFFFSVVVVVVFEDAITFCDVPQQKKIGMKDTSC